MRLTSRSPIPARDGPDRRCSATVRSADPETRRSARSMGRRPHSRLVIVFPVATGFVPAGASAVWVSTRWSTPNSNIFDVGVNIDMTAASTRRAGSHVEAFARRFRPRPVPPTLAAFSSRSSVSARLRNEIRLKEGEVSLLGGIFENQDTKAPERYPGAVADPHPEIPVLARPTTEPQGKRDHFLPSRRTFVRGPRV